jgi:hypothetical protein
MGRLGLRLFLNLISSKNLKNVDYNYLYYNLSFEIKLILIAFEKLKTKNYFGNFIYNVKKINIEKYKHKLSKLNTFSLYTLGVLFLPITHYPFLA